VTYVSCEAFDDFWQNKIGSTMRAVLTCVLFLVPSITSLSLSRRKLVKSGLELTGASILVFPEAAKAARGAAELDLEYYARDLFGGNRKEGNVLPSTPPTISPPRLLEGSLIPLLLNDECSSACLSTLALVQQVKAATPGKNEQAIEKDVQDQVQEYKRRAKASFYAKAPWKDEHVTDQYYFDFTAYALWRTAADLLPNYIDRDRFVRQLGRLIYEKSQSAQLLQKRPSKGSVVATIACVTEILELFKSAKFCKGYRIGEEGKSKAETIDIFDELDDDALASGASVDCLVSIFEPAILGASLQITGEQSRFAPDFVGATLAAMWEDAGIQSSWETFFVDPEYRPNPKDYFPNEKLLQFTLTRR